MTIEDATTKNRDDARLAMRVLSRAIHIRETHRDGIHAVHARVIREIVFGAQLRDAVRRLRILGIVLDVRRVDEIAIERAARRREHKARFLTAAALTQGLDEIERANDVD